MTTARVEINSAIQAARRRRLQLVIIAMVICFPLGLYIIVSFFPDNGIAFLALAACLIVIPNAFSVWFQSRLVRCPGCTAPIIGMGLVTHVKQGRPWEAFGPLITADSQLDANVMRCPLCGFCFDGDK